MTSDGSARRQDENDVLQKHIKNHTAPHDSAARNKRACYPCHRAKTRCAGGTPCLSCMKRSISENCSVDAPVKKIEPDVESGIGRALGGFEEEDKEIPFPQKQEPSSCAKNLRGPSASYGGTLEGCKNERLEAESRGASSGGSYRNSFVSHGGGFTPRLFQQALIQQQQQPTPPDYMDVDSPTYYSLQAACHSQLRSSPFVPQHSKRPIPTLRHEAMTENEPPRQYQLQGCPEAILRQMQHRDETENDSSFSYPPASTSAYTPGTMVQLALPDGGSYGYKKEQLSSFSTQDERDERYYPSTSTQTPSAMNQFTSFADVGSYVSRKRQQHPQTSTLILTPTENQKPPKAAQAPQPPQCHLNSGYRNRIGAQPIDIEAGELYFTHFHPRWPIIHMPSYKEGISKELDISVVMIGNFLKGTRASRMRALVKHDGLVACLLPKLSTIPLRKTDTNDDKTWADFYASLINIIFAFYTGDTTLISQAIMMLSTLITAMRELKLFQPPELKPDHSPSHAIKLGEQRKRLAIAVFQIDTYLSIYRSKRQTLHPSELRFTLPHSYAQWNSRPMENLDDWLAREPHYRSHTPIRELFSMPYRPPWAPPMPALFPKDIQLALCGLQQQIWDCLEKARKIPPATAFPIKPEKLSEKEEEVRDMREHLQQQLDWWKRELDLLAFRDEDGQLVTLPRSKTATSSMSEEKTAFETPNTQSPPYRPSMSFETYAGLENREQPNWKDVILSRPRALIFDTLHLYHLLSIHLHTDVASLDRLAELRAERRKQPQIPNEGPEEVALRIAATKWASPPRDTGALEALKHVPAIVGLNLNAHGGDGSREGGSRAPNATATQVPTITTLPKRDWKHLKSNLDEMPREDDSDVLDVGRSMRNKKENTTASSTTTGQSWKTAPRSRSPKETKIQPPTRMPATSLPYIYTGPNTQGYSTGPLPPSDEFVSRTPPPATQVRGSQPSDEACRGTFAGMTVRTIPDQRSACKSYRSTAREWSRKVGSPKAWTEALATGMEPAGKSNADFPTTTANHPVVNMALYTSALVLHEWRVNGGAGNACRVMGKCGNRPVKQPKLDEELLLKYVGLCGCGVEKVVGMLGGWLGGGGWKEEGGGNGKDKGEGRGCQEEGGPPGGVEGPDREIEGWSRSMHKLKQTKPNPKGDCTRSGEGRDVEMEI